MLRSSGTRLGVSNRIRVHHYCAGKRRRVAVAATAKELEAEFGAQPRTAAVRPCAQPTVFRPVDWNPCKAQDVLEVHMRNCQHAMYACEAAFLLSACRKEHLGRLPAL